MTTSDESSAERDDVVQLRFSEDDGSLVDLNAADLSEVLEGLAELTADLAKAGAFGDGVPPEVRIRPPKEGSVVIEGIVGWAATNPEGAYTMLLGTGGVVTIAIRTAERLLRGQKVSDYSYLDNGNVKINWGNGEVEEVPPEVWNRFKSLKRRTRKSIRKIMSPLGYDASSLEVRSGESSQSTDEILSAPPRSTADRTVYRTAAHADDETEIEEDTFEAEARFSNIDFEDGDRWRTVTQFGARQATIEDQEFLRQVDRGFPLRKNDLFDVTIRETRTLRPGRNAKTEWALTEVTLKRRGGRDDDDPSSEAASPSDSGTD